MYIFLSMVVGCILGCFAGHYAKKRGRNPYTWFCIGYFFGIFGLILLFVLPVRNIKAEPVQTSSPPLKPPAHPQKFWYYLDKDSKQFGPMSFNALQSASRDGKIDPQTYVWNEELDNWKPYGEFV